MSNVNIRNARRCLKPRKQHNAIAKLVPRKNGLKLGRTAADAEDVAIVSCVDVVPGNVMVAGLKLHVAPIGRPEQANITVDVSPFAGATVIVIGLDGCPALTVTAVVLELTVNNTAVVTLTMKLCGTMVAAA
jgi:hypothetical protein